MQWKALLLITTLLPLTAATQEQAEQKSETQAPIAQTVPAVEKAPAAEKSPKRSEQDADDYRASEEISEDLSVSYPVDI